VYQGAEQLIVGFQPGGTIRDARVVLRPDETLPNKFNVVGTAVYRENLDSKEWILVKPKEIVLPSDSPLLSQPEQVPTDISSLTEQKEATFEHQDIIRFED
jgi:hypothetical protein